ncbi:uncharacterized protein CTRU02_206407 [Colletotrichum truncatum]|uniref:Uncharacterized protein n=1 Tax=Colletotrichum truncatum TaxID=5467 RepID=A0ACC3Z6S5_COLTU|nr:uncharacterized protein CTRU02_09756 [Colletotrichum truncatum]KAF6787943.1 hypothetical protein CTRU02_09756 [Colletotrichum truncatum]
MKSFIPAFLVACAGVVSAAAVDATAADVQQTDVDVSPPYPVGRLGWYGAVTEGGPAVYYEGDDLTDIDAQIKSDHPEVSLFDGTMEFSDNSTAVGVPDGASFGGSEVVRLDERELETRDDRYRNECDKPWGGITYWDLDKGVRHLRSVSRCVVQARQCIRTTCDGTSATVFCNDNTYAIDMACSHLANMIEDVVSGCVLTTVSAIFQPSAQRFNVDKGYNVITATCRFFSSSGQPV